MFRYQRELISSRTKRGLQELSKTKKLGTPANLTKEDKIKVVDAIKRNRIGNLQGILLIISK